MRLHERERMSIRTSVRSSFRRSNMRLVSEKCVFELSWQQGLNNKRLRQLRRNSVTGTHLMCEHWLVNELSYAFLILLSGEASFQLRRFGRYSSGATHRRRTNAVRRDGGRQSLRHRIWRRRTTGHRRNGLGRHAHAARVYSGKFCDLFVRAPLLAFKSLGFMIFFCFRHCCTKLK